MESEIIILHLKCPPPAPTVSQLDPVHAHTSHCLMTHLNIILPSTFGSPEWPLSLRFPQQNSVYASPLLHTLYVPRSSHSSRFYQTNNNIKTLSFQNNYSDSN